MDSTGQLLSRPTLTYKQQVVETMSLQLGMYLEEYLEKVISLKACFEGAGGVGPRLICDVGL